MSGEGPLAGSPWSTPAAVGGFARSAPNPSLLQYVMRHRQRASVRRVVDIGCGAERNAAPLALSGVDVVAVDLSWPMLMAAAARPSDGRMRLVQGSMDALSLGDGSVDLIVAVNVLYRSMRHRSMGKITQRRGNSRKRRARISALIACTENLRSALQSRAIVIELWHALARTRHWRATPRAIDRRRAEP